MRANVGSQRITAGNIHTFRFPAGHPEPRRHIPYASQELTTYRDISARAKPKVDPALINHYYGSKEELFEAVVETALPLQLIDNEPSSPDSQTQGASHRAT